MLAEQHNTPLTDIAAALTGSLPRNGTGSMLANLPMGNNRITNLASAVASTDAATLAQAESSGVPIGTVMEFAGSQAPTGFLLCYGQAVSRATYAALFAAIGTVFGSGDGSTTFNLPDLRGRVVAGLDLMGGSAAGRLNTTTMNTNGIGGTGGAQTVGLTADQNGPHNHTGRTNLAGGHSHGANIPASGSASSGGSPVLGPATTSLSFSTDPVGPHEHTFATDGSGSGSAHLNVQPTMMMNKIIKAFTP